MSDRAIDRAIAHFAKTKGRRHKIETAWGFDVWCSPWTLGEKDRVFEHGNEFRARGNARLLIVKAEDEKGNRLFADLDERELLTEVDPDEIVRVSREIMRLLNEDAAAASETGEGETPKA